jgi:hypothetical protein
MRYVIETLEEKKRRKIGKGRLVWLALGKPKLTSPPFFFSRPTPPLDPILPLQMTTHPFLMFPYSFASSPMASVL